MTQRSSKVELKSGAKNPFFVKNHLRTLIVYTVFIALVNAAVFLALNELNFIYFSTNDDFVLQSLFSGALGSYYVQFPQMNFLIQKFIVSLYQIAPSVNGYGVFLFMALSVSASFVGGIFLDKFGFKMGLLIYLATIPVYYGMFLTQFQYTMVAYSLLIASAAGFIYALNLPRRNTKIFLYALSAFFLVASLCLRVETAVSAAVYFGVILFFIWLRYKKKALVLLSVVLASFAVVGAFTAADSAYYAGTEELSDFNAFFSARVEMVDRAPLDFEAHKEAFEQAGWTENDVNMFKSYIYPDDERFSVQNLENIIAARGDVLLMTDGAAVFASVISTFNDANIYVLCLLFLALIFAYLSGKRRLFAVFLFVLPFAVQVLLLMLWRPVYRAVYPHYVLSVVALLMITDLKGIKQKLGMDSLSKQNAKNLGRVASLVILVFVVVLNGNLFLNAKWDGEVKAEDPVVRDVGLAIDYFAKRPDNAYLYATDSSLIAVNESYSIFHAFPAGYLENSRVLGGWNTRSPSYNDFKAQYALETLPLDMVDNDHVYYVAGESMGPLTTYFYETYGIPVEYEKTDRLAADLYVYRIKSTDIANIGAIYEADAG